MAKKPKTIVKTILKKLTVPEAEASLLKLYTTNKNITPTSPLLKQLLQNEQPEKTTILQNILTEAEIKLDLMKMIRFYELLIDDDYRKLNGVFYTPEEIVNEMLARNVTSINNTTTICDPSCGSGVFLIKSAQKIHQTTKQPYTHIISKQIYGCDIDPRSIEKSKILLTLLAEENNENTTQLKFNLLTHDSLTAPWEKNNPQGFDYIVGNPPYVRIQHLDDNTVKAIRAQYPTAAEGNIDLYIPFVEMCLNLIKPTGTLTFINPNSYFTSAAGRLLRQQIKQHQNLHTVINFDWHQVFDDVTAYTCINTFKKTPAKNITYQEPKDKFDLTENWNKQLITKQIPATQLNKENFRFHTKTEQNIIHQIENSGKPLGKIARISVGIATLRDDLFICKEDGKGNLTKHYGGQTYQIDKASTKPIIKISKAKTQKDTASISTHIIYPYDNKATILPEQELKTKYPNTYKYLQAIKPELAKRDKGKKTYAAWYAYGRTQGLKNSTGARLITSTMNNKPNFINVQTTDALQYSGYAIYTKHNLELLAKILNSDIMKLYIQLTSKSYQHGYKSYAKAYITSYTIPELSKTDQQKLKQAKNPNQVNKILLPYYFPTKQQQQQVQKLL